MKQCPKTIFVAASVISILLFPLRIPLQAQQPSPEDRWVDSVMATMTPQEKIAQMMSVRAYSNRGLEHVNAIADLIRTHHIGGVTFFQGGPLRQTQLTTYYQQLSRIPLLVSLDAEWGLGMRLDSCFNFPYQMTLGAMTTGEPVYAMASEIARQLKCIGVNMNLAPDVDINNNPANPVIHVRSFGEDRDNVVRKGLAYMNGLQDNGVLTTAKHFPGHGDTDSDSHHTLPVIPHSRARLDSVELYPFRELIRNGLEGVMIAHLSIPAFDTSSRIPSTLSEKIVTGLLRNEMEFTGLIMTDALDMKGVTDVVPPGEIELKALQAGNDILLLPQNVPRAVNRIMQAVNDGTVTMEMIENHCRRILHFKYRAGLSSWKPSDLSGLHDRLNGPANVAIERTVYKEAITLVWNPDSLLPVSNTAGIHLASLSIGAGEITSFQQMMRNYAPVDNYTVPDGSVLSLNDPIMKKLPDYDAIIIGLHSLPTWQKNLNKTTLQIIETLKEKKPVILAVFGHPYLLSSLPDLTNITGLIVSYQDGVTSQETTAQMIFGSLPFKGRLPVSALPLFHVNTGLTTNPNGKLVYIAPEELGADLDTLKKIDSIVLKAIEEKVFPGCQIIAAKDGKVFYNKYFGYHTYDNKRKVMASDLYDIASLTKVMATTLAVMKLYQEGKIDIDRMLGEYLPYLRGTDKGTVVIREMMAHQARFVPWIPFYKSLLRDGQPDTCVFRHELSEEFPVRVCEGLYIHRDYVYTLYDTIVNSRLLNRQSYRYSDLGFYFLLQVIEQVTNMPMETYVKRYFYDPMGLSTITFRPRDRFPLSRIVPTEFDREFRHCLVHGDVHDQGAAMLGGVSGHAGLFSNAADLAVIMQMLLQKGTYGGKKYLDEAIVDEFTRYQFPLNNNRRGIGFDKPEPERRTNGPACPETSERSFGHSGFTGTYVWADPENNLSYVFLSNRVYPDAANNKLIEQQLRTRIHQLFYHALPHIGK
ncbi:MAG: glycoside hydrolase family 3 N-terminal domain-containing protein [Bacteroidales bacterium]|nr:glycoside hydrolase family 3 N-terminal domain-containing protein [Bacteroidales bacterium]